MADPPRGTDNGLLSSKNDPLSAVLNLVRTRGELLCRSHFGDPFGIEFPSGPVHFHAVVSGSIWVRMGGGEPAVRVPAGSFLLFPHGDGHTLASSRDEAAVELITAVRERTAEDRSQHLFRYGGSGEPAELICLRFTYENPLAERLLEALPRAIVVLPKRGRDTQRLAITAASLLEELDQSAPGGAVMIARLIDLAFIQMLRLWVADHPTMTGWLSGSADERIGRALASLHAAPGRRWTVAELAAQAGLARSAFNKRFVSLVGKPPLTYLIDWKLNLAADRLRATREQIGRIALDLGYASEPAFSRAFKARFGVSPKGLRDGIGKSG